MNTALIFAGGSGIRMNTKAKPKQFLELNGRAIIIHTLEYFEKHPEIDSICVVCIADWIDYLKTLLDLHGIQKVRWIVPGGETGQESIFNGMQAIYADAENPKETVVLVHDGVRPLISASLISENIQSVLKNGSAVTVAPAAETIFTSSPEQADQIGSILNRAQCQLARAPQSFFLEDLYNAHQQAKTDHITNMIDSASLMKHYGKPLFMIQGPVENIKITTPMDFYLFRAIYEIRENAQIFGF